MNFSKSGVISALASRRSVRIAVAGDFCLDKYLYIDASRDEPSLETGETAYQVTGRALFAGAAGTIANNLAALGVTVEAAGFIGEDGEGWELERCLRSIGAEVSGLIRSPLVCTPTYVKPVYVKGSSKRELNRLDLRNFSVTPAEVEDAVIENMRNALSRCDAMIICDQFTERNCSAVTDRVREAVSEISSAFPEKPVLADSRGFIGEFHGVTVKCNDSEAVNTFGGQDKSDESLRECGLRLSERNGCPAIITCGGRGAWYFEAGEADFVPAFVVEGETDICGAGDSFNAGYALGRSLGLTGVDSVLLANAVASITIQQLGVTGTATRFEVIKRIQDGKLRS